MRPEQIYELGTALEERVRAQVDTTARFEILIRSHRRRRALTLAVVAVAVLAIVVGLLNFLGSREPPVATTPTTVAPRGQASLPVEVFLVLRGDYRVEVNTGACEGSGPLTGIGEGSLVHVHDQTVYESADDSPTIALPTGIEITRSDEGASFLLGGDESGACVFFLEDLGYDIEAYEDINLFPQADPDVPGGWRRSGQRVIYSLGES